jgi:hypothetical protein
MESQMIYPNRLKHSRTLMPIGMLCLVIALIWPRYIPRVGHPDWSDGIRGVLFGLSIGLNLLAVVQANRPRSCIKS